MSRLYDKAAWHRTRAAKLATDPVCQRPGCYQLASQVDHIKPIVEGGELYDWDNLQSLCQACHSSKTARENAGSRSCTIPIAHQGVRGSGYAGKS